MKRQHSACQALSEPQRRRVRVAIATITVLSIGLLFLGFWSGHESTGEKIGAMDYLADTALQAQNAQNDPLLLVDSGFELTGVSSDELVIGYATNESVGVATVRVKNALQSQGWVLVGDANQGILTFSGQGAKTNGSIGCLIQFSPLGQGCALVAQRW